tara:strand:+ start:134 stop:532 length:399 start_codon:yes stop_codon:yes gene_type:complete
MIPSLSPADRYPMVLFGLLFAFAISTLTASTPTSAQFPWVSSSKKIADNTGGFAVTLTDSDQFGFSIDHIDARDLSCIFESGFTTKSTGECTGLGLAISKQIVDDHAGSIEVESTVGEGTAVTIRLAVDCDN